jgi:hypothetical protein
VEVEVDKVVWMEEVEEDEPVGVTLFPHAHRAAGVEYSSTGNILGKWVKVGVP